jgi:hypothetical protein
MKGDYSQLGLMKIDLPSAYLVMRLEVVSGECYNLGWRRIVTHP